MKMGQMKSFKLNFSCLLVVTAILLLALVGRAQASSEICNAGLEGRGEPTAAVKEQKLIGTQVLTSRPFVPRPPETQAKPGSISINGSGQSQGEDLATVKKEAEIIAKLAHDLGVSVPPHQINLVSSEQFAALAAMGGYAAPHWHQGAELVRSMPGTGGVMEFVTKGCPTCRAYYSSSTPDEEQRSIIMHVVGHNDVSSTSKFYVNRPSDAPRASLYLADYMADAYLHYDHAQVSYFFQLLQSVGQVQDYVFGTFEEPKRFTPQVTALSHEVRPQAVSRSQDPLGEAPRIAAEPGKLDLPKAWPQTLSVLQALSVNLPPESPKWQHDIFQLFEQTQRAFPATFQTKTMNEGWATIMMYLLARHLPWTDSSDLVKYGQLLSGVAYPSLTNPYYMGLTGWWNLYEQFTARPEISKLDEFSKDKAFIAYGRGMLAVMNDTEWARVALDKRWIEKHSLYLYRPRTMQEVYSGSPQHYDKNLVALSRDWKRVQNALIRHHIDRKYRSIPSFVLKNPARTDGTITLLQQNIEDQPLEPVSAVKTLFVLSQIMHRPVAAEVFLALLDQAPSESNQYHTLFGIAVSTIAGAGAPQERRFNIARVRISVNPNGEFDFQPIEPLGENLANWESLRIRLVANAQQSLQNYRDSVLVGMSSELQDAEKKRWMQTAASVSESAVAGHKHLVNYAHGYDAAIREYMNFIELRLRASLQAAISGKTSLTRTAKGIKLSVLPEIPTFRYDGQFINRRIQMKPPAPIDNADSSMGERGPFDLDDGSTVASGPYMPGDIFSPKKPPQDGKGKGQGESGEEQDGESEDGEPEGDGPPSGGQGKGGGKDPYEIEVPLKIYGEMLADILELPNIRRTNGANSEIVSVRRGQVRKTSGILKWDAIMLNAIEKARALRKSRGLPYDSSVPVSDLIAEALPLIEPSDYVVSGRMEQPRPDFEAVVFYLKDLTGSMGGERNVIAQNTAFNLQALLAARYKKVHSVYIGFSDTAVEMSEKDVFSKFIGGGTRYASATELTKKIMERFPSAKFNRYVVTIGDGETSPYDADEFTAHLREMSPELQYAAFVQTISDYPVLPHALRGLKEEWPWVNSTVVNDRSEIFRALQEIFPKGGAKP